MKLPETIWNHLKPFETIGTIGTIETIETFISIEELLRQK